MRRTLAAILVILVINLTAIDAAMAGAPLPNPPQPQVNNEYQPYSPEQLENLVAPIALYPDPLLAQLLPASTFVDQVQQAADWVGTNGANGIDDQDWDTSVKAVGHYPMVIQMMAQRIDWTTSLGQAYVNQSTDVMTAIQHLRRMARSHGNLYSTPQQQVVYEGGYIAIVPAHPRFIYIPTYDPAVVYVRPHREAVVTGAAIGFTAGLVIGAWLSRDCDWREHRVYYNGWRGDHGWRGRSRQYVQVNNVTYVNNTYNVVNVNRTVVNRPVNVTTINNYNSVHQNIRYNNIEHNNTIVRSNHGMEHPALADRYQRPPDPDHGMSTPAGRNDARQLPTHPVRGLPTVAAPLQVGQHNTEQLDHHASKTIYGTVTRPVSNPSSARQETISARDQGFSSRASKQEVNHRPVWTPTAAAKIESKAVERHEQKKERPEKLDKGQKQEQKGHNR